MGQKISVDSATLMNKGLELIEASALFQIDAAQVEIVIHPQSIIHSLVEYVDGSFLAQLGAPDMRIPIAHALAWPERIDSGSASLDLIAAAQLDFQTPDLANAPCLKLATQVAARRDGSAIVLNAANEIAVDAFLRGQLQFTSIASVIEHCLARISAPPPADLGEVLNIDNEARRVASQALSSLASSR